MWNEQDIYQLLEEHGFWYQVTKHEAIHTIEEARQVELPYPEADDKCLFIRDDKHRHFYLLMAHADTRVNLKEFKKAQQTRSLTFASEEELLEHLGLLPGSVTPFGLLNDEAHTVQFFLERKLTEGSGIIGLHPNTNTASVWMKAADLLAILQEHGVEVQLVDF